MSRARFCAEASDSERDLRKCLGAELAVSRARDNEHVEEQCSAGFPNLIASEENAAKG